MIGGLLGEIFLREVPQHLLNGVMAGKYRVFGSVIRNAASGRIVGYLQEAAPLAALMSGPFGGAVAVAQVAMSAATIAQGEAVRHGVGRVETGVEKLEQGVGRVEAEIDRGFSNMRSGFAALEQIGIANIALSAVGVGISIAGFAVMSAKIDGVKNAIHGLSQQMDVVNIKLYEVQRDAIDADLADLRALSKGFDEGWRLGDQAAIRRWQDVAQGALSYQSRFEARADRVLVHGARAYEDADAFLDALNLAIGLRVAALSACNESYAAQEAAADGARVIERLTGAIGITDLVAGASGQQMATPGTQEWAIAQASARERSIGLAQKIRQREAAAHSRAAPLAALERRDIHARDWLQAAREEKVAPILIMVEPNPSGRPVS